MLSSDITLTAKEVETIIKKSLEAREFSYSPYSKFRVGACLITNDKKLYTGCNVENASYGGAICAERTAFVKAVSEGNKDILAIAVSTDTDAFASPCGFCRQFMNEFNPNLPVYLVNPDGQYKLTNLKDLLPDAFGPMNLGISV
ncbi:cytidine deaminase [Neoconidiobolus thromboides FSU 785]|nr:cytidine deaminase [Neoconidiobolus thromboides FSU 785]